MGHRVLRAADSFWRPSNLLGVENTDIGGQVEANHLGARLWRLEPGQYSTRHRHRETEELYVLLEGTGRMRAGDDLLTLEPLSAVVVDPATLRQIFNDTQADQLWLITGAPPEAIKSSLEMTEDDVAWMYPDGPRAKPPELE